MMALKCLRCGSLNAEVAIMKSVATTTGATISPRCIGMVVGSLSGTIAYGVVPYCVAERLRYQRRRLSPRAGCGYREPYVL
jgi:hypothetical protein